MRVKISAATVRGEFVRRIELISGENLLACNQCGKCSAGCPVAIGIDTLPNQIIRLAQLGIEEVLDSRTIWACAACLSCVARCPNGIDLPRIMEALRVLGMERAGDSLDATQLSPEMVGDLPQLALVAGFRKFTS